MFDGFDEFTITTSGGTVFGRRGGSGPAVLLLHGIPQTHLMWRLVAPILAREFTVVATDLRGYGASGVGAGGPDHVEYAMRDLARDQVEVMDRLGYQQFSVVGHDRGARCGYRAALDHPDRVDRLAVLDIVPTTDAFARANRDFALGYWVWSFLAAPAPIPERLIAGAPDTVVDHMLDEWADRPEVFTDEVRAAYRQQFHDPDRVHAICEQYRAAATHDITHDDADRARGFACPVLVLWSDSGAIARWYDPLEVWRGWASEVIGAPVRSGHFLAEEAPEETTRLLADFLRSIPRDSNAPSAEAAQGLRT
ncbi:haloacetate dehalogenase [Nocardia transvalensis]|uniref:Haloacetate dehalogenase n=1 Tax=Nocardia transvalensis TaxID=37333 RepID=A0A7W9UHH3_9NOCA|nr:alpha/beta hydrolase [Nocardia transvalensis]MBB5913186.1 haloacetate dehalogenase [Nocardia transvalensis]